MAPCKLAEDMEPRRNVLICYVARIYHPFTIERVTIPLARRNLHGSLDGEEGGMHVSSCQSRWDKSAKCGSICFMLYHTMLLYIVHRML